MVNFKSLAAKAKDLVEKRGGTDSLKDDAGELKDIATGKGSLADKAKAAAEAVKDPGAKGEETPVAKTEEQPKPTGGAKRKARTKTEEHRPG